MKTFNIPRKYRSFIVPILIFVVIAALSLTLGQQSFNDFIKIMQENEKLTKENTLLAAKRDYLQNSSINISAKTRALVSAVPGENSTLHTFSTLRGLAQQEGVFISEIKVIGAGTGESTAGLQEVALSFQVAGSVSQILSYIRQLEASAPISRVVKINLAGFGDVFASGVSVSSFWAKLPQELPPVASGVEPLTEADEKLISEIERLEIFSGGGLDVPPPQTNRTNPFAF